MSSRRDTGELLYDPEIKKTALSLHKAAKEARVQRSAGTSGLQDSDSDDSAGSYSTTLRGSPPSSPHKLSSNTPQISSFTPSSLSNPPPLSPTLHKMAATNQNPQSLMHFMHPSPSDVPEGIPMPIIEGDQELFW